MAEAKVKTEVVTPGKVTEVCRQFLTSADEGLAQRLQDEEFGIKYQWNRDSRKVARVDVPLAKTVHDLEEERLQKERFDFLLQQKKLAEEDERMAHQLQQEEQQHGEQEKELLAQKDAEVALQLQQEEEKKKEQAANMIVQKDAEVALQLHQEEEKRKEQTANTMEYDDAKIALEMQKEEILNKERSRIRREMEDQALARGFQEQERQLLEMKKIERELREQRHQLELELQHEEEMRRLGSRTENVFISERNSRPVANRDTVAILRRGEAQGYRLSDADFLSEEDRLKIQQLQDEELAKALQEHEEKKARRAHREIAADIERHDAQLARIMQEVERMEALKRRYREEGHTYIIYPVPHVELTRSMSSGMHPNNGAARVNNFGEYSQISVPRDDFSSGRTGAVPGHAGPPVYSVTDRNRNQRSNTSHGESTWQSSSTDASPLHSPLPAPNSSPPPPPPPPISGGATQGPVYSSVSHSRVTETRVTTEPSTGYSAVSRDGSHQRPHKQNVSSTLPAHYQQPVTTPVRRQSSKDKSCKQQ